MRSKFMIVGLVACMATAGCGGSDGGSSGKLNEAVETALRESMTQDDVPFEVNEETFGCIADKVLDDETFGPALEAAFDEGKTGTDLLDTVDSDENEEALTVMTLACFSSEELISVMGGDLSTDGSELSEEQRACLVEELDKIDPDERAAGFLALSAGTQGNAAAGDITGALVTCLGTDFG